MLCASHDGASWIAAVLGAWHVPQFARVPSHRSPCSGCRVRCMIRAVGRWRHTPPLVRFRERCRLQVAGVTVHSFNNGPHGATGRSKSGWQRLSRWLYTVHCGCRPWLLGHRHPPPTRTHLPRPHGPPACLAPLVHWFTGSQVIVHTQVGFIIDCLQTCDLCSPRPARVELCRCAASLSSGHRAVPALCWQGVVGASLVVVVVVVAPACCARLLSFVACLVYVAGTYLGSNPTPSGPCKAWRGKCSLSKDRCSPSHLRVHIVARGLRPPAIVACEYVFGIAFTLDYMLHLFISENKMVYVFSWGAVVDLLAILPVFAVNSDTSIGFLVRAPRPRRRGSSPLHLGLRGRCPSHACMAFASWWHVFPVGAAGVPCLPGAADPARLPHVLFGRLL